MGNFCKCTVSQAQCPPGPLEAVPHTVVIMVGYQADGRALGDGLLLWQEVHTLHPVVPPLKWETENQQSPSYNRNASNPEAKNPSQKSVCRETMVWTTDSYCGQRDKEENCQVREADSLPESLLEHC